MKHVDDMKIIFKVESARRVLMQNLKKGDIFICDEKQWRATSNPSLVGTVWGIEVEELS